MMQNTQDKKWFDELVLELRIQGVSGAVIGDTVASAHELLDDSGKHADEVFGPARDYAAALELPAPPAYDWVRTSLGPILVSLVALVMFAQAAPAWVQSQQLLLSPAQLAFAATPVVVMALFPLYLAAVVRRLWLLILLVVICSLSGLLSGVVTPITPDDAWLVISPIPWVIGSAAVMVGVAIVQTIRSRRPESADDIVDPRYGSTAGSPFGSRALVLVTNWLFPLLALCLLGFTLAFV